MARIEVSVKSKKGASTQAAHKTGKATAAAVVAKTKPAAKTPMTTRMDRPLSSPGYKRKGGAIKRKCGGKS